MFQEEKEIFNNKIQVPVEDSRGLSEDKLLSIIILDFQDKLQIKLKDPSEYSFNYTETIDLGDFEIIRTNQMLDINFAEFKTQVVEMLNQYQKKEMFFKCKLLNNKCSLIFYGKVKIKTIIYLTLELNLTNQREIINELVVTIQNLQESNVVLRKQLQHNKKLLLDRERELHDINKSRKIVEEKLFKDHQNISIIFSKMLTEFQTVVSKKISNIESRISLTTNKVNVYKQNQNMKCDNAQLLVKSLENLKISANENLDKIQNLERQNADLIQSKMDLEKNVENLKNSLIDQEISCENISKLNKELQKKLKNKECIILEKQKTIDEISKDLVQANGMLVNFNNHYDNKCKEVGTLSVALNNQEQEMKELEKKYGNLQIQFDTYCLEWNKQKFDIINKELLLSNQKIQELEENIRKVNKINVLLTEKINRTMNLP